MENTLSVVAGAGGFIGGHLVERLVAEGRQVRSVDVKPIHEWWQVHDTAENVDKIDVGVLDNARIVCHGADEVYNLAADMGGMGFIDFNKLDCMLSVLPSTQMLVGAQFEDVGRFFYASSACVYPGYLQNVSSVTPNLCETDAYPADAEDGYGWEKLFTERMCRHFLEDVGLETRVARYHNIYGPHGSWTGGREKAPAALCRKVAEAAIHRRDVIEIWGDSDTTRTFTYIDDCVDGTLHVARGDYDGPVNIGSDEIVTIAELARTIERVAGVELQHKYVPGPRGVRGRSSDNTLVRELYGWEPSTKLLNGIESTYAWVYDQVRRTG